MLKTTDPETVRRQQNMAMSDPNAKVRQVIPYVAEYADARKALTSAQKELDALKQKMIQDEVTYQKTQEKALGFQQKALDIEQERQKNLIQIQSKTLEIAQIKQKIAEAERKQQQAEKKYQDYVDGLYRKQQARLNEILGKKKQSLFLEAKLNAEKIKGKELTEEELEALRNYAEVDEMISQLKDIKLGSFKGQQVITNELASKGGWASSVVVERAQDINKEILAVQNRQFDLQQQIKTALDKYSVIQ